MPKDYGLSASWALFSMCHLASYQRSREAVLLFLSIMMGGSMLHPVSLLTRQVYPGHCAVLSRGFLRPRAPEPRSRAWSLGWSLDYSSWPAAARYKRCGSLHGHHVTEVSSTESHLPRRHTLTCLANANLDRLTHLKLLPASVQSPHQFHRCRERWSRRPETRAQRRFRFDSETE